MAPKTMRAVPIKDRKGLSLLLYLSDAPVPILAKGQVLICMHLFGLNKMDIL
jgi:NADPH:quinone reductase-like Zn-dependent oxidoreductase